MDAFVSGAKEEERLSTEVPDNEPWRNVPNVNFNRDDRKVKLNANWDDNANEKLRRTLERGESA